MTKFNLIFGCRMVLALVLFCIVLPAGGFALESDETETAKTKGLEPILTYISKSWDTLTRSMEDCSTVVDPKLAEHSVLYLPADVPVSAQVEDMQRRCHVQVKALPEKIVRPGQLDTSKLDPPGLLYLEHKYVVPGGRFNEMYGWDSYFIIRGLLREGRVELARGMVDNFFFEIEHYGAMLNANRTYYLTRSQPPFLSSMFVDVYGALQKSGHKDPVWLAKAYADLEKDYEMWNREPHRAGDTGLSRYYDFGEGPPAEAVQDESGFYRKVATYFFFHPGQADNYIQENLPGPMQPVAGSLYSQQVCDVPATMARAECEKRREFKLSSDYYKSDRSMRESGFDVSFRFGTIGAATHHYAPVCLNSLLYKTEKDLAEMTMMLGKQSESATWARQAESRKKQIQKYLWDANSGLFFDYNLDKKERSNYIYITAYYPLWAGAATKEQAAALVKNLSKLEQPGGLVMSPYETEGQWDFPYAWAPTQIIALEGLRKYGYNTDADRISYNFVSMIAENFHRDGTIREKYNAVTRSSETAVKAGYNINVVGFGWTNAVFLVFLHDLPQATAEKLAEEQMHPEAGF